MIGANKTYRIMISGGGTGGHIYPAISIAQALKDSTAEVDILFVGAKGKMEMQKVPEAGFEIVGLWISGIQRRLTLQNLLFPLKLVVSLLISFQLLRTFKPDVVIGVGGYASGPLLLAAIIKKIPTLIQEQNAYAGLTNKWLARSVNTICVAYEGMEKFFPIEKIVITGNPVRKNIQMELGKKESAYRFFELDPTKKTILIIGGSLGARTINESILSGINQLMEADVQVIWQTGAYYHQEVLARVKEQLDHRLKIFNFISEMQEAYLVSDIVISRAGALSIAELMLTGKPSILVPSPNVAEDHQTLNTKTLVNKGAAILVADLAAHEDLVKTALSLVSDKVKQEALSKNILSMGHPEAARDIAKEIRALVA